jgi:hypothetical protein
LNEFDESEDDIPQLSDVGWQMVEVVERMMSKNFPLADIVVALDMSPEMIALLLAQAKLERTELEIEARDLM